MIESIKIKIKLFLNYFKNKKENTLEFKTKKLKINKESDVERWSNDNVFHVNWNERTIIMASFLNEKANIIEFGAGNMFVKTILKTNQLYTASDIIKRFSETIVCDLNKPIELDLKLFDTAIFSGVFEYVYDIEAIFKKLFDSDVNQVILSYSCADIVNLSRLKNGWLSDLKKDELENIFHKFKYTIKNYQEWENQSIYNLIKDIE